MAEASARTPEPVQEVARLLANPSLAALQQARMRLALVAPPGLVDALDGEILRRQRHFARAAEHLDRALRSYPQLLPAYHCAALAHVALAQRGRAREIWQGLLERAPADPVARYQIALTHHDEGQPLEAARWYEEHLGRQPDALPARFNLGLVLLQAGEARRAADALEVVVARDPQHRRAWIALGKACRGCGQPDRAIEACLAADRLPPRDAEPLATAAAALVDKLELPEENTLLDRAIAVEPRLTRLHWALGANRSNLGLHAEAMESLRTALSLEPTDAAGHSRMLLELHYDTALGNPAELAAAHRAWAFQHTNGIARIPLVRSPHAGPLRVGFLSPRFGAGPLATLFLPVLRALDRGAMHVTLYSAWTHDDENARAMQSAADAWRALPADDDAAAAMIAADRIDVLVDLAGHAPGHRLTMLARKPAPVQVSWLDYFDTTGLDAIDYVLSDAVHTPASDAALFTEQLVLMPGCRFVYAPVVPTRRSEAPSLRNGHVTFGSSNRHAKISGPVLQAWKTILDAVPGARLELRSSVYGGPGTVQWITERWRAAGLPVERIAFRPYVAVSEAMRAYEAIDIALDTSPYNGGVTTCDALVAGVPVIALLGDRMIARQSAALLAAAGRSEWIASSWPDYVTRAVALADPQRLADVRAALYDAMPGSPLCDVPQFARRLGQTLVMLHERGPRNGRPGAPLDGVA